MVYNNIWRGNKFPDAFPFVKIEKRVQVLITTFLKSNKLIIDLQSGFSKKRGMIDHLVCLETFIREAFIKKEHLIAIVFDLEKASDSTWKFGIMRDLYNLNLRLPGFLSNILFDRNFRVCIESTLSDLHNQKEGTPQGSIFMVIHFSIKINSIKCLIPSVLMIS